MDCAIYLLRREYDQAREQAQQGIWSLDRTKSGDGITKMERDLLYDIIHLCDLADEMNANRAKA